MYISGDITNFEKRLHQLPATTGDLAQFTTEGRGYLATPFATISGVYQEGVIPATTDNWTKEMRLQQFRVTQDAAVFTVDYFTSAPPISAIIQQDSGVADSHDVFGVGNVHKVTQLTAAQNVTLTRLDMQMRYLSLPSGNVVGEIWTSNADAPNTLLGSGVPILASSVMSGTNGWVALSGLSVTLTSGTKYFVGCRITDSTDYNRVAIGWRNTGGGQVHYIGTAVPAWTPGNGFQDYPWRLWGY